MCASALEQAPLPAQSVLSTLAAGGIHEDPRKLADFAARTEARNCELDEEEAGIGVTRRGAAVLFDLSVSLVLAVFCIVAGVYAVSSPDGLLLLERRRPCLGIILATV